MTLLATLSCWSCAISCTYSQEVAACRFSVGIGSCWRRRAGCREVVLVGASTPLAPSVFQPLGVTLLSGIVVEDPSGILRVVSEAGGTSFFGRSVRKVNVRV